MSKAVEIFLKQIEVGPMQNYCYLLGDAQSQEVAIVDPAWDIDKILGVIQEEDLKPVAIFLTHGHYDHTDGVEEILKNHGIAIYAHESENSVYRIHKDINKVRHNQIITIGNIEIRCLHTPGHSPGGLCFYVENILLTGDTLFINGCGRCDLPGGNAQEMYYSLYETISQLPDETIIYPGHSYGGKSSDTLGNQKKTNHYLTCKGLEEFINERM